MEERVYVGFHVLRMSRSPGQISSTFSRKRAANVRNCHLCPRSKVSPMSPVGTVKQRALTVAALDGRMRNHHSRERHGGLKIQPQRELHLPIGADADLVGHRLRQDSEIASRRCR